MRATKMNCSGTVSLFMRHLSKVVWFEGMYLAPHHFQAQTQSFEDLIQFTTTSLWFEPYGLVGFELDAEGLRNGNVALVHARGLFPDGLAFHMPDSDPLPPSRFIADLFPPTIESTIVYLAVPSRQVEGPNCILEPHSDQDHLRFAAEVRSLHDDNTGRDDRQVRLARKNIRFLLDLEALEGMVCLPIARVMRDGTGHLLYDPRFIPPCLQIRASERLMMISRRLIGILDEKSSTLSRARAGGRSMAGFSSGEIANFWFVHTINTSLAVLRHLCTSERGHPEQLYLELVRLGGGLCTFGLDSHPQTLPVYDHLNLGQCFQVLDEHIRIHLELVVPTNCISVPLKQTSRYFYEGEITDQRCLDRARWIFAIRSEIGELELISRTQRLVKICSHQLLPEVVKAALPGLALSHLPVPPSAVAPKVESQYFGISRAGSAWEQIVQTRGVGVYVPGEIPLPEIELLVILDS
jgi:type VI secretion system protein ImpJ